MDYVAAADWRTRSWRTPSWIGQTGECWIHHGASGSATLATLRAYERYHVDTLGWYALGYSWAVTADGTIYEGRGWHRAGAHTRGRNNISHAVLLVGDWSSGTVPDAMIRSAARVIRHGRDIGALTSDCTIGGHRQAPDQSTSCPGAAGMRAVPKIRRLADRLDDPEEQPMDGILLYVPARTGTPDALAALWQTVGRGDGVAVTADRDLAQAELDRGTTVLAVGGPAADELGDAEAVVGDTWAETGEQLAERLDEA